MRAMMAGICELVSHAPDVADAAKLGTTFGHLRELTRIMETEINEAVSSCTRARGQMIEGLTTEKPPLHRRPCSQKTKHAIRGERVNRYEEVCVGKYYEEKCEGRVS